MLYKISYLYISYISYEISDIVYNISIFGKIDILYVISDILYKIYDI